MLWLVIGLLWFWALGIRGRAGGILFNLGLIVLIVQIGQILLSLIPG